jgi:hypothetical protein
LKKYLFLILACSLAGSAQTRVFAREQTRSHDDLEAVAETKSESDLDPEIGLKATATIGMATTVGGAFLYGFYKMSQQASWQTDESDTSLGENRAYNPRTYKVDPITLGLRMATAHGVKATHAILDRALSYGRSALDFAYEWRWSIGITVAALIGGAIAMGFIGAAAPVIAPPAAPAVIPAGLIPGFGAFVRVAADQVCGICLNDMTVATSSHLICEHTFHTDCISQWLGIRVMCPMCRAL